jgi:Domain of unknown function (DUF4424)
VVDKGRAGAFVSFCGADVQQVSDTQFEMRKKKFEPDRDLDVLFVDGYVEE